ncbi:MAG: hypothetical protein ACQEW5_18765 [Bacillota bacterium]
MSVRMGFRTVDLRNAMIGETPGSKKITKMDSGKFLLNLDGLVELKAPYLNEDDTELILNNYKIDDWKNHNFKASNGENTKVDEGIESKNIFL